MTRYSATLAGTRYAFGDLRALMAAASPLRSGDQLAGIAATSARERAAAQAILADVPLTRFLEEPLVPYETDDVTRLIFDSHDQLAFEPLADFTVGQLREWLLAYETTTAQLTSAAPGIT